jgi:hypothetical protein
VEGIGHVTSGEWMMRRGKGHLDERVGEDR